MGGHRSKRTTESALRTVSSSPRDPNSCPFEDFLQYLDSSLSRNAFLRLSESIIKKMKATLAILRQTDQKVATDIVERILFAIDAFQEACSQLHPSAFVTIARILIHAGNSQFRDRGLYLLAKFLHNGNKKEEEKDETHKSLSDVGKDCLELIFVTFCDKSESYKTRRWAGLLVLELTSHSEDNVALIGLMPEDKRRKLGSQILYEENEILRTLSGRILTTFTSSDVIQKEMLFPEQTGKELIAQYPEQAPSASQWDKRFSSYLDDIWDKIADTENHGTIDFAQNLVTFPEEYLNTKTISTYHRSIYVVLADCVYIYIHPGDKGFDNAIDIPFHLITDIRVEPTPLDLSIGAKPPADLILHIKYIGGDQPYVNSSPSELSVVQLTFKDTDLATGIGKAIQACRAKHNSEAGGQDKAGDNERESGHRGRSESAKQISSKKASQSDERLALDGNYTGVNSKATKQTSFKKASQSDERLALDGNYTDSNAKAAKQTSFRKASQSEEGLVLDGNYTDTNAKTGKGQANSDIHAKEHVIESSLDESFVDSFVGVGMASESSPIIARDKTLPENKSHNSSDDDRILYGASQLRDRGRRSGLVTGGSKPPGEVGGVGKMIKSILKAPTNINKRNEVNEVSGMTINTSDEFGISSPHVHQSPSVALPRNPADDALPPTQHDESVDELALLPAALPPKKKQALKSKKPLGRSKKADENGNAASGSTLQQDKVSESKYPLAKGDQSTGGIETAPEKVSKHHTEEVERSWSIEPDSPKLTALPSKKSVETGKGASKKRKSELEILNRARRGTGRNALPVQETGNDFADGTPSKSDVRPGPSKRANKPPSKKLAKIQQVDEKEHSVTAAAIVTKPKKGQKKPLLRPKAALKAKEPVADDKDIVHIDTGGQHEELDTLDSLQRHESFFEEAFHDYDLPNMNGEPSFTPVPPLSAVTKMASKMADMFGFDDQPAEPKRKARIYGKPAQRTTLAPQKQSKPKAKGSLKGKEREEVDPLPEVDLLPEQPKNRSPTTTAKSPATALGKEVEMIYISSDEESDDPGDIEHHQPQAISQAATIKLDEKTISTTAVKSESSTPMVLEAPSDLSPEDQSTPGTTLLPHEAGSIPALLEAPSELSPENQSTPATAHLPREAAHASAGPSKLRNVVNAANLVDDHLARKTPIVAFGRNGPKNQGVSSVLKLKPVDNPRLKTDMAKLVNAVAFGPPKKRPSPEHTPHFEAPLPKRVKRVEVAANTVMDDDAGRDDIPDMLPHRMRPSSSLAPRQDSCIEGSLLCSSQSRVDENGSPHAKPMIIEETANVAQIRRRTFSIAKNIPLISQRKAKTTNKGAFDDPDDDMQLAFDDEPTIALGFAGPSPNRKPQLLGREKEATVNQRSLLSRPTTARKYVEVIPETDHASTVNSVDPFVERQPRQPSNFAKRLKGERPVRQKVTIETEARHQPLPKAADHQPRKRSFVFEPEVAVPDPEKTLVDVENQNPWRRSRSLSLGSSASSTDIAGDKRSVTSSVAEELTAEEEWKRSLQPPYTNLTDTLMCMVHELVRDLVDKETAIDDIVDEYTRIGTRKVEGLERQASADRREVESQFFNTLQQVTRSFRQTRDATIALNAEWEDLDDLELQWRKRQHELQDFMNEKIKYVTDGTWKDQLKMRG